MRCSLPILFALQGAVTISGLFALAVQPAPDAALLAVPLSAAAAGGIVRIATHHGAQLIGTGPLPGWIVLRGGDDGLRGALRGAGVLLVAAPPAGCGTTISVASA